MIGAAALVLLLPGLSIFAWLRGSDALEQPARRDPLCALAEICALSIAVDALLAVLLLQMGIQLSGAALVTGYGIFALVAVLGLLRPGGLARRSWTVSRAAGLLLALGFVLALVAWRLWQARALALPAWVDSVHHVYIVARIIALGGLPADWLPAIPAPFSYHCGFHVIAALFAVASRSAPAEATLWFGQVLNAAVALSVYRAAYAFQGEALSPGLPRWAAAGLAALLTGFVLQMPAYYLTWGRYTMLTGLIILGPLLAAAWELWQGERAGAGARLALLMGGLCVTHYLVMLVAGLFLALLFAAGILRGWRSPSMRWRMLRFAAWVVIGLALALPWLARVLADNLAGVRLGVVNPLARAGPAAQVTPEYLRYLLYLVGPRHNHILLGFAALGLAAALGRRALRLPGLWGLLLALLSLPWGLRLLVFRPDHFAILLFFPAAILLAYLLASGAAAVSAVTHRAWASRAALLLVSALLLAWGMQQTARILNPGTIIATPADLRALRWVQNHTPLDARFYINSTFWQGHSYRGVDGGYWLEPYTGRAALIPPGTYDIAGPEWVEQINQWAEKSASLRGCDAAFWSLIEANHLNYVYLRDGVGTLQANMLTNCPGLNVVYQAEGVTVFQVVKK